MSGRYMSDDQLLDRLRVLSEKLANTDLDTVLYAIRWIELVQQTARMATETAQRQTNDGRFDAVYERMRLLETKQVDLQQRIRSLEYINDKLAKALGSDDDHDDE